MKEVIKDCVLTINVGSSSIKFALYEMGEMLIRVYSGELEGIGTKKIQLNFENYIKNHKIGVNVDIGEHDTGIAFVVDWLEKSADFDRIKVTGHRFVQGLKYTEPIIVTKALLDELYDIREFDPEHLPGEIKMIETLRSRHPEMIQIACFDTSFHTTMPRVVKMLPIPRRYFALGIQKYGFHGLSYSYIMDEVRRTEGHSASKEKIIIAHLGQGASMVAVKDGKSTDTSMGFTPASGLPMGTRTGDIDPGIALYMMKTEELLPHEFNDLINHQSGMLGISETSSDMRDLLDLQKTDIRAAEAVELFCYQARKWIGSFAAVLGGIDRLIFTGGIGENSPEIRERICRDLQFLGVEINETKNKSNEGIISESYAKVAVQVMKTNEQIMIAQIACQVLDHTLKN
jgi:acetate kinase